MTLNLENDCTKYSRMRFDAEQSAFYCTKCSHAKNQLIHNEDHRTDFKFTLYLYNPESPILRWLDPLRKIGDSSL
ncbi:hypothetical protein D3C73_605500 [compost metagenome]|uniref:Uncharacterized protein n=1 Tax=Paenibacillus jilunlii TaxID=682956 RepID=A0ABR5SRN8_9BACL|nr:hypothetical protein AML91_19240 [Paenibacillus jilunlii]